MEEKFTIELADGTRLTASLNGNNFITDHVIPDEMLCEDNLIGVKINGEYHQQMVLDGKNDVYFDGKEQTWFILRDITTAELKEMEVNAKLEYLAMELGVEL